MKLQIAPSTKQDKVKKQKKQSFLHDDTGRTLEVIILTSLPVLIGVGVGILIYNAVSDGTQNVESANSIVDVAAEDTTEDTVEDTTENTTENTAENTNQTTSSTTTEAVEVTTTTEAVEVTTTTQATTTDTSPTDTTTTTAEDLEQGGFLPPEGFPGPTGFLYPGGFVPPEPPETEKFLSSFEVSKLSSAYYHSCVILKDGGVECWGNNEYGQLGDGTTETRYGLVSVSGISQSNPVIEISVGGDFSCAILQDSTVTCWGNNEYGQLGNGITGGFSAPVQVLGISNAIQISAGLSHACALLQDDYDPTDFESAILSISVQCWGNGISGELGNSSNDDQSSPVIVNELYYPIQVSAGASSTCALIGFAGTVRCWGSNYSGGLGDGTTTDTNFPSTRVSGIGLASLFSANEVATQVSTGEGYACAIREYGSVRCWGYNGQGQLGDGSTTDSSTPVDVSGGIDAIDISTGEQHTCAVLRDSTVSCWGVNSSGQLGDGTLIDRIVPTLVTGVSGVNKVFVGSEHTCALLTTGEIRCWGNNSGNQLSYN